MRRLPHPFTGFHMQLPYCNLNHVHNVTLLPLSGNSVLLELRNGGPPPQRSSLRRGLLGELDSWGNGFNKLWRYALDGQKIVDRADRRGGSSL